MKLTFGSGKVVRHPVDADVLRALADGGDVVVLEAGPAQYVQTNFAVIEYCDRDHHYECAEDTTPQLIEKIFLTFLAGRDLEPLFPWREIEF
ncbi:MAG: hypothetical protein AB7N71_03105 [Phycisphaerae bacterium]